MSVQEDNRREREREGGEREGEKVAREREGGEREVKKERVG